MIHPLVDLPIHVKSSMKKVVELSLLNHVNPQEGSLFHLRNTSNHNYVMYYVLDQAHVLTTALHV